MPFIRNFLAVIGLVSVIGAGFVYYELQPLYRSLDPAAGQFYREIGARLWNNPDLGSAMVVMVPAKKGMTPDDVVDSLKSLAIQNNLLLVGEAPFHTQVQAVTGKPYRYVNILSFCDARVGMQMIDANNAYAAFMPCRIAVVQSKEDPQQVYLVMMDLDILIAAGKQLPAPVKSEAMRVRDTLRALMMGAAQGQL